MPCVSCLTAATSASTVIIPGLLVFRTEGEDEKPSGFAVWDRVLDYMGGANGKI